MQRNAFLTLKLSVHAHAQDTFNGLKQEHYLCLPVPVIFKLKGNEIKHSSWPENENKLQIFRLGASFGCSINIYTRETLFSISAS